MAKAMVTYYVNQQDAVFSREFRWGENEMAPRKEPKRNIFLSKTFFFPCLTPRLLPQLFILKEHIVITCILLPICWIICSFIADIIFYL